MRRAAKVDTFHAEVRELFRVHGCEWEDTSGVGRGFPDAIVGYGRQTLLVEVKSGERSAKRKGATADRQRDFARRFPVATISTRQAAMMTIAWLKCQ